MIFKLSFDLSREFDKTFNIFVCACMWVGRVIVLL